MIDSIQNFIDSYSGIFDVLQAIGCQMKTIDRQQWVLYFETFINYGQAKSTKGSAFV